MALVKPKRIQPKVKAGNLNFSNFDKKHPNPPVEDSDVRLANGASVSVLVDPEAEGDSDLHFSNFETTLPKGKRKIRASATRKSKRIRANDTSLNLPNGEDPEEDYKDGSDESTTFLMNADADEDYNESPFLDEDEADDSDIVAEIDDQVDPDLDYDLDADADNEDDMDWDQSDEDVDLPEPEAEPVDIDVAAEAEEPEDTTALPIAEIRQVDDTIKNLAFVMNGETLLAVKDTTVVASMSKQRAIRASISDVYTTAAYQGVLKQEVRRHGLMAALTANGFKTERINLNESRLLAKAIKQETNRIQARLNKVTASKQEAQEQSVQIAAVGINRNVFQSENSLRAALVHELTAAGLKNPSRMLQRVFAAHGHEYVQEVLAVAESLSEKPLDVRNSYAEMLDITNGEDIEADIDDTNEDEDQDVDGFDLSPAPITAALVRRPQRVTASNADGSLTVTASARAEAILRGDVPLF